jgi:hypothetical protein
VACCWLCNSWAMRSVPVVVAEDRLEVEWLKWGGILRAEGGGRALP